MTNRYLRQTQLPEVGTKGQEKLRNSKVLIVGAGGLASPALLYLAGAGIGTIGLIDGDRVEEANLHRQVLFDMESVGSFKVDAAFSRLKALNPDVEVITYPYFLTAQTADETLKPFDLIIDGCDRFETKTLLNDRARKLKIPLVYASVTGWDGLLGVTGLDDAHSCFRCLYPKAPKNDLGSCSVSGVMGPVVGMMGSLQAVEGIKILLSKLSLSLTPLSNTLLTIDARNLSIQKRNLTKNPLCPTCSTHASKLDTQERSNIEPYPLVTLTEFYQNKTAHQLIDVREALERDGEMQNLAFRTSGAQPLHFPLSQIEANPGVAKEWLSQNTSGRTPLFFCKSGVRARIASALVFKATGISTPVLAASFDDLIGSLHEAID